MALVPGAPSHGSLTEPRPRPGKTQGMSPTSRPPFLAAASLVGLTAALAVAAPASAATNPYTPQGVCGAGFTFVREAPVVTQHTGAVHEQRGLIVLMHSRAKREFCAVNFKLAGSRVGVPTWTTLSMTGSGGRGPRPDRGNYRYYAGPLRMKGARHALVSVSGTIASKVKGTPATGGF